MSKYSTIFLQKKTKIIKILLFILQYDEKYRA